LRCLRYSHIEGTCGVLHSGVPRRLIGATEPLQKTIDRVPWDQNYAADLGMWNLSRLAEAVHGWNRDAGHLRKFSNAVSYTFNRRGAVAHAR
jgi:hypothetical protein